MAIKFANYAWAAAVTAALLTALYKDTWYEDTGDISSLRRAHSSSISGGLRASPYSVGVGGDGYPMYGSGGFPEDSKGRVDHSVLRLAQSKSGSRVV